MHRVPISLSSTPSQIISYYKTNKVGVRRLSRDRPSDNRNQAEFLSPLGNLSRFPPENWREKCPSAGGNVEPSNSRVCRAMTVSMSHDRWQSSKQLACLIVATERTKAKLLTKEPKFGITCLCRHLSNYSSVSPSLPPPSATPPQVCTFLTCAVFAVFASEKFGRRRHQKNKKRFNFYFPENKSFSLCVS